MNISAVTQATAFATADPDRSYAAAAVPVGQGHRKKRRTLAAKVCTSTLTHHRGNVLVFKSLMFDRL